MTTLSPDFASSFAEERRSLTESREIRRWVKICWKAIAGGMRLLDAWSLANRRTERPARRRVKDNPSRADRPLPRASISPADVATGPAPREGVSKTSEDASNGLGHPALPACTRPGLAGHVQPLAGGGSGEPASSSSTRLPRDPEEIARLTRRLIAEGKIQGGKT